MRLLLNLPILVPLDDDLDLIRLFCLFVMVAASKWVPERHVFEEIRTDPLVSDVE
jgi:hypothetical protein